MKNFQNIFGSGSKPEEESQWISTSDFMTVLMVIFLFITILYINVINQAISTYPDSMNKVYRELYKEFKDDMGKWNAELDRETLTIRFRAPEIFFQPGKSIIQRRFIKILDDFCPRYFKVIYRSKDNISEIRIEGHTSVEWRDLPSEEAYFENMELSQDRTRSVLQYCLNLIKEKPEFNRKWIKSHLTANGLSSSKPLLGCEKPECHRRVEFRVRIDAEAILDQILKTITFNRKKDRDI